MDTPSPLILLAAGGTGGHLFPAEALGVELIKRGLRVRLVTDARALRYSGLFSNDMIDLVPSETVRGRSPVALARTALMLATGTVVAFNLIRRLRPKAIIGFGGYPTVPPLIAARLAGIPGIIHDANAVLGRANRFLSGHVRAIATSLPGVLDRDPGLAGKTTTVGTPMRPAILTAAAVPYVSPLPGGAFRLLVVGGSQGARVMSDVVPGAIERLDPSLRSRLILTQQVRDEDMARVRAVYDRLEISAELAPFFTDLPAGLASNHLIVSRSGAGTWLDRPGSVRQCRRAVAGRGCVADCASRIFIRPAGGGDIGARCRTSTAGRHGREGPRRRATRCRRAARRSRDESRRNLRRARRTNKLHAQIAARWANRRGACQNGDADRNAKELRSWRAC
jgi:UDP-N-acetylglucosamine--N-acetylmuramyl-(pentapeptide) pyrophosphoryl-undecaprenol N-acetylglucosamine transferase